MARVTQDEIDRLIGGDHHDPHGILGAHPERDGVTIRALRPLAGNVEVVLADGERRPMRHVHEGVFAITLPPVSRLSGDEPVAVPDYRLEVTYTDGPATVVGDDPYRYSPVAGRGRPAPDRRRPARAAVDRARRPRPLGTTARPWDLSTGTSFAVWAPNAQGTRVRGFYSGRVRVSHAFAGPAGVWELFMPGLGGDAYKFDMRGPTGLAEKADPMARYAESAARHRIRRRHRRSMSGTTPSG